MNARTSLVPAAATAAFLVMGCATGSGSTTASSRGNTVTYEELAGTNAATVYEALERLRPDWMSSRGPISMTDPGGNNMDPRTARPNVYMNGMRMGDLDSLRDVYVQDVASLRFWEAGEASARFGMGNPRGVIEIIPRS